MDESLIQLCRVQDDGPMGCKLLLYRKKNSDVSELDGTVRIGSANSVPAAAVIRRIKRYPESLGLKGPQAVFKSEVKSCSSTVELPLILKDLSYCEVVRMCGVAVKCIDITEYQLRRQITNNILTLRDESVGSEQD